MNEIAVAVGDLVRFCHRRGDLNQRAQGGPSGAEGIAGHQRIYARRPDHYQREYRLQYRHSYDDIHLVLNGRADGYDTLAGIVEEIKTTRRPPDELDDSLNELHLSQGRLYGAMLAKQLDLAGITIRLTRFNIDTGEEYRQDEYRTRKSLDDFLDVTLGAFADWVQTLSAIADARDASLNTLPFPHGQFRAGQRHLAELSYKCIDQGGQLLLSAPTGSGKTAAVLFPSLKALATGKHDKIAFVTQKTVGRKAAEDDLERCRQAGYRGTAVSLTAQETVCFSPGKACHGEDCPYAKGYYDKLPAALAAGIRRGQLRRLEIEALAKEFEVCPYELARDFVPWVDVIIADSHYWFSLSASVGDAAKRWTLLIDEAHNLPGRARNMYSAELSKALLMSARAESNGNIKRALEGINRQLLTLNREPWDEIDFHSEAQPPNALQRTLTVFAEAVAEQLAADPTALQARASLREFYFDCLHWSRVQSVWGEEFRFERQRDNGRQSLLLRLHCLDPARLLTAQHRQRHAVIAFSATLTPEHWCHQTLGFSDTAVSHRATSPFAPEQLRVTLTVDIDTRYRARQRTLDELARRLSAWLSASPGNSIVYFPSYRYLRDGLAAISEMQGVSDRCVWQQQPELSERQRVELLELLGQRQDVAAFCILGGVFGEGIDLPGDRLVNVAVIGVGMPQVNRHTRQLQEWYEQRFGKGFEYTFLYPGMQKVDQALGRVVRSDTDSGTALLIDPRYREAAYRQLLPPWWDYEMAPSVD